MADGIQECIHVSESILTNVDMIDDSWVALSYTGKYNVSC